MSRAPDSGITLDIHRRRSVPWSGTAAQAGTRIQFTRLWLYMTLIGGVVAVQRFGPEAGPLTYLAFSAWALVGPRQAIQALTLSWLVGVLNPGVAGDPSPAILGLRWLVLAAAAIRVVLASLAFSISVRRMPEYAVWLLGFSLVALGNALMQEPVAMVSVYKTLAFAAGVLAVVEGFRLAQDVRFWDHWFLAVWVFLVVGSLPLLASEMGYLRNGRGFQGLLNHPQAYGVSLAPVLSFWAGELLFRRRISLPPLALALVAAGLIVATESRTAVIAVVAGLLVTYFAVSWAGEGRRRSDQRRYATVATGRLVGFALCIIALVFYFGSAGIKQFLIKWETNSNVREALTSTFAPKALCSWEGFVRRPWFGIGFGQPSSGCGVVDEWEPFGQAGLIVTAPVEKRFIGTALLEEVGIVGTLIFVVLLWRIFRPVWRQADAATLWMAASALFVNGGEAVLLSFGGIGLWVWLILGYARSRAAW